LNSPEELVLETKRLNQNAIAISDHGTLAGHRSFQKACQKNQIKCILGAEIYFTKDRWNKTPVSKREDDISLYSHLVVLAKNQNGLKNLSKIVEESFKSFYYKPLTDMELLSEYSDDLIILSACMGGAAAKLILGGYESEAKDLLINFQQIWKDDFYIELQSHNPPELNSKLLQFSEELSISPVATPDAHYANEKDRATEEALLILNSHPKPGENISYAESTKYENLLDRYNYLYPNRKMSFQNIDLFLQTRSQMESSFKKAGVDREDIFNNTVEIANKIGNYEFLQKQDLLPRPVGINPDKTLRKLCEEGLKDKKITSQEYIDRLDYELEVIIKKDLSTYFLIVRDIINWAKNNKILIGPGRGSSAGSLICWLLRITEVDPLKYNLLFSRFLDAEREDAADIDIDVQDNRRGEVKEYIRKRFGSENVASISTYSFFKDKGVFRDAARVLSVPLKDVNKFLKGMDTFEDCERNFEGQWFRSQYPEVMNLARNFRGKMRGSGIHAAGVVISNQPISDYAPVETKVDPGNDISGRVPVIAYDMNEAADIGLIKIDLLGLKTLAVVSDTLSMIKSRRGKEIDLNSINLDDELVYRDISNGFCRGVFQVDTPTYTSLVQSMGIDKFEDLVISNALVRPGAMKTIGKDLIDTKSNLKQTQNIHPIYDEITKETYSFVVYQEQVMSLCVELAGMSMGDAARVRSIIGKKKDPKEFDKYKEKFILGASKNISESLAEKLWHDFEAHAGYSFNKCLSGDMTISLELDSSLYGEIHLSDLYDLWDKNDGDIFISTYSKGLIDRGKIKSISKNGIKRIVRLSTESGHEIKSTHNHKHLTEFGWRRADQITINDQLIVSDFESELTKPRLSKVICIESLVFPEMTYDIEMDTEGHNFIANGVVTHNSHAVSYSLLSYWTAWLKHYYQTEFIYAALKNEQDSGTRTEYLIEAKRLGIEILLPHINKSDLDFKIEGDSIRFGLTSIKFISNNVGNKIINKRPFDNYKHFHDVSTKKFSGINIRVIGSLNSIGAAEFEDNPKTGKESSSYYEILGIPNFSTNIPDHWSISKIDDYEDEGVFILYAMVKGIKRGPGWSRLDLIDGSGTTGIFHKENSEIETGKMYLFLIANNKIERAIESENIDDKVDDPLIRYLNAKELKLENNKKAIISFNSRKTKAGKFMANIIFSNKEKDLSSAIVFPNEYAKCLDKAKPGSAVDILLSKTSNDSTYIKEII
jgi:DNA-directed DNA polymerase III PolC